MKHAAIIQARFNSSRLRGKILTDICGKPVLQRVIERVQKSKYIDEVFVATSIAQDNLPVLRLCADMGVRAFAGSEDDVLDRYYQLAKLIEPEYIIRVTADCPFYDWTILDAAIQSMDTQTDYLKDFEETLPDGLDIEIMKFEALKQSWQEAVHHSEREHVTLFIRKHPERFAHQDFKYLSGNYNHLRWTLDEEADLTLVKTVYEHFCSIDRPNFLTHDLLALFEARPELAAINAHIIRNEGLAKSILAESTTKR